MASWVPTCGCRWPRELTTTVRTPRPSRSETSASGAPRRRPPPRITVIEPHPVFIAAFASFCGILDLRPLSTTAAGDTPSNEPTWAIVIIVIAFYLKLHSWYDSDSQQ